MNLTLVTETYPPEINGVAMTLERLVNGLAARGHTVQIIRPRQKVDEFKNIKGNPRHLIVSGMPIPGYDSLKFGLPSMKSILASWKTFKPDIVHVATEGPLGWSAIRTARRMGLPISSSFHTNFHHYANHYRSGFLQSAALRYLRWIHNRTSLTLVPSEDVAEFLGKNSFNNVSILERGVDTRLFTPDKRDTALRASWGAGETTKVALYVGRLAWEKNLPLTIKAFAGMNAVDSDMKLVLVGDGPARSELENAHPEFIFAGMRRGDDLARHYASADLFLFASISETFGNVVTESMASGLVTLTYDYAAGRRFITNNVNGLTVPFDDEEKYLAAAHELIVNPEKWKSLRNAARKTALGISWASVSEHFEKYLSAIINRRNESGKDASNHSSDSLIDSNSS